MRIQILLAAALFLALFVSAAAADGHATAADIRSGDPFRVGDAVRALAGTPHEERKLIAPVVLPAIFDLVGSDAPARLRATVLRLVTMFKDCDLPLWDRVSACCLDRGDFVRQEAIDTLVTLSGDSEEKAKKLFAHLVLALKDPSWRVRETAADATEKAKIGGKELAPFLAEALADEDPKFRRFDPDQFLLTRRALVAALARAKKHAAPARETLEDLLDDKDAELRAGAAAALGAIGEAAKKSERSLADALSDDDPAVRRAAAGALAAVGAEEAKSGRALGKLLGDASADVALAAAEAFASLPALAARELGALLRALKHDAPRIRAATAAALGAVGPEAKRAIPVLEKLAERDDAEPVREAAKAALESIRPD